MRRTIEILAAAVALSPLALPSMARAQNGAVVQPLPSAAAVERLNANLARLSQSPQDVEALLGAGQAALDLGDVQAANGFFTRANLVNPNVGRVKLGLAIVELALKQPDDAAANFDAAEALGEHAKDYLADRGLAYDLTGQQAKAQRDYQGALQADPQDQKAMLRYAVSLGISGRLADADKLLEPALKSGDREAWRLRAFIYAMNGRQGEARNITQSVMPKGLADALDPYMARVSLLTPAQKAAAAHYGDFPANVLRMAVPAPNTAVAAAPARAAPAPAKREDEGKKSKDKRQKTSRDTPAPTPTPAPAPARSEPAPPPVQQAQAQLQSPAPPPAARPLVTQSATAPATARLVPPPPPAPQRSLADTVLGLTVPAAEKREAKTTADMEAVARIQQEQARKEAEARDKAEKEAKARAEAERKRQLKENPARIWVQIASGRNVKALAFDLRRLRKTYSDAIGGEAGWTFPWGRNNRLLVGPFRKMSGAKDAIAKIKQQGGDAFVFESEAGDEVRKIGE